MSQPRLRRASRFGPRSRRGTRRRLEPWLERLEDRTVLSTISVGNTRAWEGSPLVSTAAGDNGQAVFTVTLDTPSASTVTVNYTTVDGTALGRVGLPPANTLDYHDYVTTSGTLTFSPGQTSKTVTVTTLFDSIDEFDETFSLVLSNPVGATIASGQGTATLLANTLPVKIHYESGSDAGEPYSGDPRGFAEFSNKIYFGAFDHFSGRELTSWDGNTSTEYNVITTSLVGVDPQFLTVFNGSLIFAGGPFQAASQGIWKSNGTTAGTSRLVSLTTYNYSDFTFGYEYSVSGFYPMGGFLYFVGNDGTTGQELWRTDGTTAGTTRVTNLNPGSGNGVLALAPSGLTDPIGKSIAVIGDTLYFHGTSGTNTAALYKYDGTTGTTSLVKDFAAPTGSRKALTMFTSFNGLLYFRDPLDALWKSDGTPGGTVPVVTGSGAGVSSVGVLTEVNGTLYFKSSVAASGQELWKSDGTPAGTVLVKDINPGTGNSTPQMLTKVGNQLFFVAYDTTRGYALWKTDGTTTGTVLVKDINPATDLVSGYYAWLTDGGGVLYLNANDGVHGTELWRSDGTPEGTALVADIHHPASSTRLNADPRSITPIGGNLYFGAIDYYDGRETWMLPAPEAKLYAFAGQVQEGDPLNFVIMLGAPSSQPVTVSYATADGTGKAGIDYVAASGTVTFAPGETLKIIPIATIEDTLYDTGRQFTITLSNPVNARVGFYGATADIVNDDPAPTLTVSDATAVVEGGTATFTLTLSAPADATLPFTVSTVNGTAVGGKDFTAIAAQTVSFSPGETTRTVTVATTDDVIDEEDVETFSIKVTTTTAATILDGTGDATILDNDAAPGLTTTAIGTIEGGVVVFTVSLPAPQGSGRTVTVNYATANFTAIAGADYVATSGTLTFAPGDLSKTVTVSTINDRIDEDPEAFLLNLSSPVNAILVNSSVAGNIADDDPNAVITLSDARPIGASGAGPVPEGASAVFTITLDTPDGAGLGSGKTVSVFLATFDATATHNADYTPISTTLTFAPGEITKTVTVATLDDTTDEDDETFTLKAVTVTGADLARGQGTATIADNDPMPEARVEGAIAHEGDPAVFTVRLDRASARTVSVNYGTIAGTATAGADYATTTGTLTFDPGETVRTVSVATLLDIPDDESAETFLLVLSSPVNATLAATPRDVATGIITDIRPRVSISDARGLEGETLLFDVTLDQIGAEPVVVDYVTVDDTAVAGREYGFTIGQLVFAPGTTTRQVSVATTNDDLRTGVAARFTLNVTAVTGATVLDGVGTGLIDDDDVDPEILVDNVYVTEGGVATFTVRLSRPTTATVTVGYETVDGSALAASDYTTSAGTIVFGPRETAKSLAVATTGDALDEFDEVFKLRLLAPVNATLGISEASGVIEDDDPLVVASVSDATATEGGTLTFAVTLDRPSGREVYVEVQTIAGTAQAGDDYVARQLVLTFAPGETSKSVVVTSLDDEVYEELSETFTLTIRSTGYAARGRDVGTGTLLDNDPPPVLTIDDASDLEAASLLAFAVRLDRPSGQPVTIHYATAATSGSLAAKAGIDYQSASGTVTIAPGQTVGTVTIVVIDDQLPEAHETFQVALTAPVGATIADDRATGTIFDDDTPPVVSIADAAAVTEGGDALFTVTLDRPSGRDVTVDLALVPGTASARDYLSGRVSSTGVVVPISRVVFSPGQTSKTVGVTTVNDNIDESDSESFELVVTQVYYATVGDGRGAGSILDNDPTPVVSISNAPSVLEGQVARLVVTLDRPSGRDISVMFDVVGDTATAGVDFTWETGTVVIPAGQTVASIDVTTIDDSDESDATRETFHVELTQATRAVLGAQRTGTGTIVDNDGPVIVSVHLNQAIEGDDMVAALSLSTGSAMPVWVYFSTVEQQRYHYAIPYEDYIPTAGTVVFQPGETMKLVPIPTIDDTTIPEVDILVLEVELSTASNATIETPRDQNWIFDDDRVGVVYVAQNDPEALEGDDLVFSIYRDYYSDDPVVVQYAVIGGTATSGADYQTGFDLKQVVFRGDTRRIEVRVPTLRDTVTDPDETVSLEVVSVVNGYNTLFNNTEWGVIRDRLPIASVGDAVVVEGGVATFDVTLDYATDQFVVVGVAVIEGGSATPGADYRARTDTPFLIFEPGQTKASFHVLTYTDSTYEEPETFFVGLQAAYLAEIGRAEGRGTIKEMGPVVVNITDAGAAELVDPSVERLTNFPGNSGARYLLQLPEALLFVRTVLRGGVFGGSDTVDAELWLAEGAGGQRRLARFDWMTELVAMGGWAYFAADGKLYKTDGLAVISIAEPRPGEGGDISALTVVGSTTPSPVLYFIRETPDRGEELWVSDGTEAGTRMLHAVGQGPGGNASVRGLTDVNGVLFFAARSPATGHGPDDWIIWRSNGNSAGTAVVNWLGVNPATTSPSLFTALDDRLYFVVESTGSGPGFSSRLWSVGSTGFGNGPVALVSNLYVRDLVVAGGTLFLDANGPDFLAQGGDAAVDRGLWTLRGSTLRFVTEIRHRWYTSLTALGSRVFFQGSSTPPSEDNFYGNGELWVSDGSTAALVKEIAPGAAPAFVSYLTASNGLIFFIAHQGDNRYDVWSSDGTAANTRRLTNFTSEPEGYTPYALTPRSDGIDFIANDGVNGFEIWRYAPRSLALEPGPVSEGANAYFKVYLDRPSPAPVSVRVTAADGTARAFVDYINSIGQVTFQPGQTALYIPIPTIDDDLDEEPERFTLTLISADPPQRIVLGEDRTGTAWIVDNPADPKPVVSVATPAPVVEGHSLSFVVSLDRPSGKFVNVQVTLLAGTAGAADFNTQGGTLRFAPGETSKVVTIATYADLLDEDDLETFTLRITPNENALEGTTEAVGSILDDDPPPIISISDAPQVVEGNKAVFLVSLNTPSGRPVTVTFATSDDSARAGSDYTAVTAGTITFAPGETARTIEIATIDDLLDEDPVQVFHVDLTAATNATLGTPTQAEGRIADNDLPPVVSVATPALAVEGSTLDVTVALSAPSERTVSVVFTTTNGSAQAGADYQAAAGTIIFAPGETAHVVSIVTIDDALDEDDTESLTLALSAPVNATLGASAAGLIGDNDEPPTVTILDASSVIEGATARFAVAFDVPSGRVVSVSYAIADGTARVGLDVAGLGGTLVFQPGETSKWIDVATLLDALDEFDETFTVSITAVNATVARGGATGFIIDDDDPPQVSILDAFPVVEGATARFTIRLDAPSGKPVSVGYRTVDGTAMAGIDYAAAAGTVVFAPGEMLRSVDVTTLDDPLDEDDIQDFFLELTTVENATPSAGRGRGAIADNDAPPTVSITDASAVEGRDLTFVFTLSAPSERLVSIAFSTLDDTAAASADFLAASGTIVFAPGETSRALVINSFDDALDEDDPETFTLALSAPIHVNLARPTATGRIEDDDLPPTVTIADAPLVVEGSSVLFPVSLDVPSGRVVTVSYTVLDGSAHGGTDFLTRSGTLTFAPGETSKTIQVVTLNDALDEFDETFTVVITAINATVGDDLAVGVLADDDAPPTVTVIGATATEGTALTFTVRLDAPSGKPVSVSYNTLDGTAIAGLDYQPAADTLLFQPGETTKTIQVVSLDDRLDEDDAETFSLVLLSAENAALGMTRATGTLLDNDLPPVVSIADAATVVEGATAVFTVSLDAPSGRVVTIQVATAGGTAGAGSDFGAVATTLTFAPGETVKSVAITTIDDLLDEDDPESFTLSLSAPGNAQLGDGQALGRIGDNDDPPIVSIFDAGSVVEGTTARFLVTLSNPSGRVVSVAYRVVDGTTTAGADYLASTGNIVFQPGETSKWIDLATLDDSLDEFDETLTLTITPTHATLGAATAGATLLDNDAPPIVSVDDAAVIEGGNLAFRVVLDAPSGKPVAVTFQTADGTAQAGRDYLATAGTITFQPGETSRIVVVATTDDLLDEDDVESLTLELTAADQAVLGDARALGGITDNDAPPVLSISDATIVEGGLLSFTITLSEASGRTVSVGYATADGTARAGGDYQAASGTITFAPGETSRTVSLATVDDLLDEDDFEFFTIALSEAVNATIGRNPGTGSVSDNDQPPVVSIADAPIVTEGGMASFALSLSAASGRPVTVTYTVLEGTALADSDYSTRAGSVTFLPGETSKSIDVITLDDAIDEFDEDFSVSIGAINATLGRMQATGRISDNDAPSSVAVVAGSAVEGSPLLFTLTLNSPSGKPVSFDFRTLNGTALAGSDYVSQTGTITFAPGETSRIVAITTIDDALDEDDFQTVTLELYSAVNATIGGSARTVGTIADNEPLPVLSVGNASATEGGTLTFTVTLDAPSERTVSVDYATSDGTAAVGSDYRSASGTLTFTPGQTSKTVTVASINDSLDEDDVETFLLALRNPTNAAIVQGGGTGSIVDNDAMPSVSLVGSPTVAEGTLVAFSLTLNTASGRPVVVSFTTVAGTAEADVDFSALAGSVTFLPGETSKTIEVATTNDALDEPNESFSLQLTSALNATINRATSTATITDDDPAPTVSVVDAIAVEGAPLLFVVALSGPSGRTVGVSISTSNGSALSGADYTSTQNLALTFAPGETTKTVSVATLLDTLDEADETLTVTLSRVSNATINLAQATGTIVDDDPPPTVSIADAAQDENRGSLVFTVTLDTPSGKTVTVAFATADGTAVAPSDYQAATGTVTFAPGQTSQTISITLVNDTRDEDDVETMSLSLTSATNATLGRARAVGSIRDNDALPSLSVANVSVIEGDVVAFVVTLNAPSGRLVTVDYATSSGTALSDVDFRASMGSLTFAPGETTKTIEVATTGDAIDEIDESFSIVLGNVLNATINRGTATATITDDDPVPTMSVAEVSAVEGSPLVFVVSLNGPSGKTVDVNLSTSNGTARSGLDYVSTQNVALTFAPGETTKTVSVATLLDALDEADETVIVTLARVSNATLGTAQATGTIVDDDPAPTVSIADVRLTEGNSGTSAAVFQVTLSAASGQTVTVDYATADGTATAGGDYTAASGRLTFAPGVVSQTVSISVVGDTAIEPDETFFVNLLSASNATFADAQGQATILNNDTRITINNVRLSEGQSGLTPFVFQISLSAPVPFPVSVTCTVTNGTATAGSDYVLPSVTRITIPANQPSAPFVVYVQGDTVVETTERFNVNLSLPTNATISDPLGYGDIVNDDTAPRPAMAPDRSVALSSTASGPDLNPSDLARAVDEAIARWDAVDASEDPRWIAIDEIAVDKETSREDLAYPRRAWSIAKAEISPDRRGSRLCSAQAPERPRLSAIPIVVRDEGSGTGCGAVSTDDIP